MQKVLQRFISVTGQLHLVLFAPHDNANQRDEDVQWGVDCVDDVRYCFAVIVHSSQTVVHRLVEFIVHDQDEFHVGRVSVCVEWTSYFGVISR